MTTGADAGPVDELQFDRAIREDSAPRGHLACSHCGTPIADVYFQVGDAAVCEGCKEVAQTDQETAAAGARRSARFLSAGGLGLGAALVGAVIYWAVAAITGWELALVALLIGWMVGWAVQRGSHGFGGRRYQVLAMTLTYFSVGLAYVPTAFTAAREGLEKASKTPAVQQATPAPHTASPAATPVAATVSPAATPTSSTGSPAATPPAPPSSPAPVQTGARGRGAPPTLAGAGAALALLLALCLLGAFVLPVVVVVGSLPSGILSAVIIGVGMRQAWKMTAARPFRISGPYQVGSGPAAMLRSR